MQQQHQFLNLAQVNSQKQSIKCCFDKASLPFRLSPQFLEQAYLEITQRQFQLGSLLGSTHKQISKYFMNYTPLSCKIVELRDKYLIGGFKIAWNSNKLYVGHIVSGKRHGKGVLIGQKGRIYEGQFQNNQRNGNAIQIYEHGNFYIGEFFNNKRHGNGKMIWVKAESKKNQKIKVHFQYYNGQWRDGEPHGQGYHSTDNINHFGSFKNGLRNGKGIQMSATSLVNKYIYEGMFVNGHRSGKGFYFQQNYQIYQGEFRDGNKNGYGKLYLIEQQEEYEGFFQNNKRSGIGICKTNDGVVYRGLFAQDKPNGTGEYTKISKNNIIEINKVTQKKRAQTATKKQNAKQRMEIKSAHLLRQTLMKTAKSDKPIYIRSIFTSENQKDKNINNNSHSRSSKQLSKFSHLNFPKKITKKQWNPQQLIKCKDKYCRCHQSLNKKQCSIDQQRLTIIFSSRKTLFRIPQV